MLHDQSVFSQCTVPQKSESCIKPEPVTCGTWACHMWNPNPSHVEPEPVTCENRACHMWNPSLSHVEPESVTCGTWACHMWNPSLSHVEPKPVTCGTMQYSSTVHHYSVCLSIPLGCEPDTYLHLRLHPWQARFICGNSNHCWVRYCKKKLWTILQN